MARTTMQADAVDPPGDPRNPDKFAKWLEKQPREWSVAIAGRVALRALPIARSYGDISSVMLSIFRATAIARFAARYPNHPTALAAAGARQHAEATARRSSGSSARAAAAAAAAVAASTARASAEYAAAANSALLWDFRYEEPTIWTAIEKDVQALFNGTLTAEQLAVSTLWAPGTLSVSAGAKWMEQSQRLLVLGGHWQVWIDWYNGLAVERPALGRSEAEDAVYTDLPGELPWDYGAEAVNLEIAQRLAKLSVETAASQIPDQSPAPLRVEERDGRVSKVADRDSPLSASERDFKAWRDPVVDHVNELVASDFAAGTNHGRVRDRLTMLGRLLPGEIADVKERQFRIGYEIERFEGLIAAYRSGADDMPVMGAPQLEDIDRLKVALKMGIEKLERWSEFRKQANEMSASTTGADSEIVGEALDQIAEAMEERPRYFDPELPITLRFLAEAVRDPVGATKTVIYGAIKSVENLISFLGQRALGIGRKGVEAVEAHISKAVATSLVVGLSSGALLLSSALPQGLAWFKPLLAALGYAG